MKVGIIQVDGKIPNLALMQIIKYHELMGDHVEWWQGPLWNYQYDKIYASKIFSFSPMPNIPDNTIKGGTGIDWLNKLPDEIAEHYPSYSLYPDCNYHLGFTTSQSIKKSDVREFKEYDADLHEQFNKNQWNIARSWSKDITDEARRQWHEEKDIYYSTSEWKKKRAYVLDRDKHLCQMCLTNRAYDVHHTTYIHFGNELTSELISVCRKCHNIIHNDKEPF